jgi:catechol 2,3-dioxygenase-like lactoylglutathione lyase family enzyme
MRPVGSLLICAALALGICAVADARAEVLALRRIGVTVADLDRTERFYRDALDFQTISRSAGAETDAARLLARPGEHVEVLRMRLGAEEVEFLRFDRPGRHYPTDTQGPDRWFQHFAVVVSDMDAAYARLQEVGLDAISQGGPQTLPQRNGHVQAFKFRDPDGHPLELLSFPPGQGRAVWHQRPGLFLGIDHSALSIAATEASLAFYRDVLGLRVVYGVTNRGPAQDRLDGIAGAVVRITGLWPHESNGPGVEFLDYRSPATGRAPPGDVAVSDASHAHLTVVVDDLRTAWANPAVHRVSPAPMMIAPAVCGVMIRDPDGHALVLEHSMTSSQACGS